MKDLNLAGIWWLPSSQQKLGGTLTFSNEEGIHLSVIGSFKDVTDMGGLASYPLILGVTSDGNLVTLYNCLQSGSQLTSAGFRSEDYLAEIAYIGVHFSDVQEIRFHRADVQYSYLSEWVGMSGFKGTPYPIAQEGSSQDGLLYSRPKKVKATTAKGTVSIQFGFRSTGDWLREVTFGQSASISIDISGELSFDDWNTQFIFPLQNLLTLAADRPISIVDVFVFSRQETFAVSDGKVAERSIQVIFRTIYGEGEQSQLLMAPNMLFTLKDVAEDFERIIASWLTVATELDSVCNLFFTVQYTPSMYLEQQFLNIVQAVELYHRRRSSRRIFPEEQHRALVNSILMKTPKEYREWLYNRLRYSNEPTLRDRLRDLIERTHDVSLPVNSAATPSRKAFIQKVVDTRNFLTHYDPSLIKKAAEGFELFRLTQVLSFLLQACFLLELRFSPDCCAEMIRRTRRWRRVTDQALRLR